MKNRQPAHSDPSRRGSLRATPFANLLILLLDARKTGTLRMQNEHGLSDTLVRFENGVPVGARMPGVAATLMQTLIPLCSRTLGDYVFVDGQDDVASGDGAVLGHVDPVALITAAMRGPLREDAVAAALAPVGVAHLSLNSDASLARYAFTDQEQWVVDSLLQKSSNLSELCALPGVNERVARRVVYLLLITRALSPLPGMRRLVSGTMERVTPVPDAGEPAQVLVAPPANPQAGRYHMQQPDGAEMEVSARRPAAVSGGDAAREPIKAGPHASVEVMQHARMVESELHSREARRLLKCGDYAAAVREAHQALRANGTGSNEALFGFLLCLSNAESGRLHPRALHHLDRALQREPNCEEAHFYKGLLLKRGGQEQEAARHFRRVLKINPNHAEAVRELRLWRSRRTSPSGTTLVARLFGRKPSIKPGQD
jgi:hypothetical protein